MIHGNIEGIRESTLRKWSVIRRAVRPGRISAGPAAEPAGAVYGNQINREMLVYLGREGEVLEIAIGSMVPVSLCRKCIFIAIRTGCPAFAAFIPIPAEIRGFRTWICRRCGFCGLIPCARWAWPRVAPRACAPRFWARWNMRSCPLDSRPRQARAHSPAAVDAGD